MRAALSFSHSSSLHDALMSKKQDTNLRRTDKPRVVNISRKRNILFSYYVTLFTGFIFTVLTASYFRLSPVVIIIPIIGTGILFIIIADFTNNFKVWLKDKQLEVQIMTPAEVCSTIEFVVFGRCGITKRTRVDSYKLLELCMNRIISDEIDTLDARQLDALHSTLKLSDTSLVFSTLAVLERLGNRRSLPFVRTLASGGWQAATEPQLIQAAQHCLSAIEERLSRLDKSDTLLRPTLPTDMLLLPSSGTPQNSSISSEQLLRPIVERQAEEDMP